jgi:peptidoglycan hydrolase-like protein with peptidoglycan-binding domain
MFNIAIPNREGCVMRQTVRGVVFFLISLLVLSGCATTAKKQDDLETQGLRNQVTALETQLQAKDDELKNLRDEMAGQPSTVTIQNKTVSEVKSRPTVRQIQLALKNAGYDPGSVDGKMGKQTRNAIKAFQKDNKLSTDGRVGNKTWSILKQNLTPKTQ